MLDTGLGAFFREQVSFDPTWGRALEIVERYINIPTHVGKLFRDSWYGVAASKDFMKVMGFSRLNPFCLLSASELTGASGETPGETVERAIQILGTRLSAVVLAVNYTCKQVIASDPPPIWKQVLADSIRDVEIGYRLGARTFDIGIEGGAIIGFAASVGKALIMADNPKAFRNWQSMCKDGASSRQEIIKVFGCEFYQVASLLMQALGFGQELAVGIACGGGKLDIRAIDISEEAKRWTAAYLWVDALINGRSYPGQVFARNFFKELIPPAKDGKNLALQVLHTEVAKIRSQGSNWTWYLPREPASAGAQSSSAQITKNS